MRHIHPMAFLQSIDKRSEYKFSVFLGDKGERNTGSTTLSNKLYRNSCRKGEKQRRQGELQSLALTFSCV